MSRGFDSRSKQGCHAVVEPVSVKSGSVPDFAKDIILPGEMKVILARVVEAEKAAQANADPRVLQSFDGRRLMPVAVFLSRLRSPQQPHDQRVLRFLGEH